MGVKYISIFNSYAKVALNILVITQAYKACVSASFITNFF